MTLYEISESMRLLSFYLDAAETDEDIQAVIDTFDSVEEQFKDKAENIIKMVKNTEAEIPAIDDEIKRLQDMKKTKQNKIERLKAYVKAQMEASGLVKIDTPIFKISIQKNGGKQKIAYDVEIDQLPEEFTVTTISPDTEAIRKALDAGESDLFHYEERGTSLRVR